MNNIDKAEVEKVGWYYNILLNKYYDVCKRIVDPNEITSITLGRNVYMAFLKNPLNISSLYINGYRDLKIFGIKVNKSNKLPNTIRINKKWSERKRASYITSKFKRVTHFYQNFSGYAKNTKI